jgi:hypothetical protein
VVDDIALAPDDLALVVGDIALADGVVRVLRPTLAVFHLWLLDFTA